MKWKRPRHPKRITISAATHRKLKERARNDVRTMAATADMMIRRALKPA